MKCPYPRCNENQSTRRMKKHVKTCQHRPLSRKIADALAANFSSTVHFPTSQPLTDREKAKRDEAARLLLEQEQELETV